MNESVFLADAKQQGLSAEQCAERIGTVRALERWLMERNLSLEVAEKAAIRAYLDEQISLRQNTAERLRTLAHYFQLTERNEIYLYFTSILGPEGVLESIAKQLALQQGVETADAVLGGFASVPIGSDPQSYPAVTHALMERLEQALPETAVRSALCGNNHQIPASVFQVEQERYRDAGSLEQYLVDRHKRQVATLQRHCDTGQVWFEQVITQAVVDYVAGNQELLSAVCKDETLYITKIPYSPAEYLAEKNPQKKRYFACHCPFVREAILTGSPKISDNWCYCSGGFAKYPYELILGRPLTVRLLQSVLRGDAVCRFAVTL